jgi:hypothetical protein
MTGVQQYLALRQALQQQLRVRDLRRVAGRDPVQAGVHGRSPDLVSQNSQFAEWSYYTFLERDPLLEPVLPRFAVFADQLQRIGGSVASGNTHAGSTKKATPRSSPTPTSRPPRSAAGTAAPGPDREAAGDPGREAGRETAHRGPECCASSRTGGERVHRPEASAHEVDARAERQAWTGPHLQGWRGGCAEDRRTRVRDHAAAPGRCRRRAAEAREPGALRSVRQGSCSQADRPDGAQDQTRRQALIKTGERRLHGAEARTRRSATAGPSGWTRTATDTIRIGPVGDNIVTKNELMSVGCPTRRTSTRSRPRPTRPASTSSRTTTSEALDRRSSTRPQRRTPPRQEGHAVGAPSAAWQDDGRREAPARRPVSTTHRRDGSGAGAKGMIRNAASQMLGRDPTKAEMEDFIAKAQTIAGEPERHHDHHELRLRRRSRQSELVLQGRR